MLLRKYGVIDYIGLIIVLPRSLQAALEICHILIHGLGIHHGILRSRRRLWVANGKGKGRELRRDQHRSPSID